MSILTNAKSDLVTLITEAGLEAKLAEDVAVKWIQKHIIITHVKNTVTNKEINQLENKEDMEKFFREKRWHALGAIGAGMADNSKVYEEVKIKDAGEDENKPWGSCVYRYELCMLTGDNDD